MCSLAAWPPTDFWKNCTDKWPSCIAAGRGEQFCEEASFCARGTAGRSVMRCPRRAAAAASASLQRASSAVGAEQSAHLSPRDRHHCTGSGIGKQTCILLTSKWKVPVAVVHQGNISQICRQQILRKLMINPVLYKPLSKDRQRGLLLT